MDAGSVMSNTIIFFYKELGTLLVEKNGSGETDCISTKQR